jgi:hypothetical protein
MQAYLKQLSSKIFSMIKIAFQSNEFWPINYLLKIRESIGTPTPKVGYLHEVLYVQYYGFL